jgi:hypothetical protein
MLCFQIAPVMPLFYGFAPNPARNDFRSASPGLDLAQVIVVRKEEQ